MSAATMIIFAIAITIGLLFATYVWAHPVFKAWRVVLYLLMIYPLLWLWAKSSKVWNKR